MAISDTWVVVLHYMCSQITSKFRATSCYRPTYTCTADNVRNAFLTLISLNSLRHESLLNPGCGPTHMHITVNGLRSEVCKK